MPIRLLGPAATRASPSVETRETTIASRRSETSEAHGPEATPADTARVNGSMSRKRVSRSPQATHRLGRLRLELGRIRPPPGDHLQAREEILKALARAGLGMWSLPEFGEATTRRCADGSWQLQLRAHAIMFNPWGAFRIVDMQAPNPPYFEMRGRDRPFAMPPGH